MRPSTASSSPFTNTYLNVGRSVEFRVQGLGSGVWGRGVPVWAVSNTILVQIVLPIFGNTCLDVEWNDYSRRPAFVSMCFIHKHVLMNCRPPRANLAHVRQSRPGSGLGFQVKVLKTF